MKKNEVTAGEIPATIKHKYERMTFFCSFEDAIAKLGPRNRLLAYESILAFGLDKVRRQNLPREVELVLTMAVPQINASHKRYRDGIKGKEYGPLGAEHGKDGGRPSKKDEMIELNANGEIDENNL